MNPNFADNMTKIRDGLMKQQSELMKTLTAVSKGDFTDKLRDVMYNENKAGEKRVRLKKKDATAILTKTNEIVFIFDNKDDGKEIFESLK
jgi:hypothetical protein